MSLPRLTQLAESEQAGWTPVKVTATSNVTMTAYAAPCRFGWLRVLGAINVIPKDNTTAVWDAVTAALDLDISRTPIKIATSLKMTFSAAGSCWVLYKPFV